MPRTIEIADPQVTENGIVLNVAIIDGNPRIELTCPGDPDGTFLADNTKLAIVSLDAFLSAVLDQFKVARGYSK